MKTLLSAILVFVLMSGSLFAQKNNKPVIKIDGKTSILKKPGSEIMPYVALKFRSATAAAYQEGRTKNVDKLKAYGILDGIDESLFQEITNEFYALFTEKMKAAGFVYKPYDEIKKSELYNKFAEETAERHYNDKNFGTADVYTPNNVPFFDYPTIITKPMKLMKELESGITCIRLTIDFAEFDMDIAKGYGLTTITTNYSAKVMPGIKITSAFQEGALQGAATGSYFNAPGMSMTNQGGVGAFFRQEQPIFIPFIDADVKTYDKSVPEFASRNFRLFGGAMQLGTFVIKPTRDDYKRAALKALETYTDEIILAINNEK